MKRKPQGDVNENSIQPPHKYRKSKHSPDSFAWWEWHNFNNNFSGLEVSYLNNISYNLKNLVLNNLTISHSVWTKLMPIIIGDNSKIEFLSLENISLNETEVSIYPRQLFDLQNIRDFTSCLKNNKNLTYLRITADHTSPADVECFKIALQSNTVLKSLHLENNFNNKLNKSEAQKCINEISETLKVNSTLTGLYLRKFNIGSDGTESLVNILEFNTTLRILDLKDSNLSFEGGQKLITYLKYNKSLVHLNISNCGLGDKFGTILQNFFCALHVNETLISADFGNTSCLNNHYLHKLIPENIEVSLKKNQAIQQNNSIALAKECELDNSSEQLEKLKNSVPYWIKYKYDSNQERAEYLSLLYSKSTEIDKIYGKFEER